ncbi:uncharacterized protein GLRG_09769 [Colletotrichum graminicola M1.001]|uniref:Uncharacterized protein n=1 Tax=Colletotrichum graminicola (strain M1.001 / M2 / FGSC 10212) TaxID=645133 RepID=E3QUT7_COLGM|nr:uncharacterized protein GLRG_09769 [Colletotrichum graminicola M1.001]EFQ34625.1 hypothetical protein GLRG_09769 [Colletotrichum graminicola M1.001]
MQNTGRLYTGPSSSTGGCYGGQLHLVGPKYVAEAKAAFFKVDKSATSYNRSA